MVIGLGILINKMGKIADVVNVAVTTANQVLTTAGQVMGKVVEVQNGGTGLIPAA